jgi:VWFA-related protein
VGGKVDLYNKIVAFVLATVLAMASVSAQNAPAPPKAQRGGYTFRVSSELVLVNVVVRDRSGAPVRDLKPEDFTVLEDGKPQHVESFDTETPELVAQEQGPSQATVNGAPLPQILSNEKPSPEATHDRRLVVIFIDLSSMQPEEIERAVTAARTYVAKQMTASDLVAVITLGDSMNVEQDFTNDHTLLDKALARLSSVTGEGFEQGSTGDTEGTPDTGAQFTPDDTEYNLFSTDRRLQAITSLAASLSRIEQRKSVLYFSSAFQRTGVENQSQLRQAINSAVRANMALYTVDIRGLQALPPGGDSTQASLRGTAAYSGKAVQNDLDTNFASQETLATLASDTGGKSFLDSNDFSRPFATMQKDTGFYYVLGYKSTNKAMDGRYRHITVRVNRRDVKLEYRQGYYGPRDFAHFNKDDRERQLEDEISSDLPITDLPVYVDTAYFRDQAGQYYVPVSVVVPASALPVVGAENQRATLDVLGVVREANTKVPVGTIRQTIKLDPTASASRRNLQYNTAFMLPPGSYHLKFVVRENQNGTLGTFETDFVIPDLKKAPLKTSSIVLAAQRSPVTKHSNNPLVHDGSEIVPNISHVFRNDQQMIVYFDVYDPASQKNGEAKDGGHVRVLASVLLFRGKVKTYETTLVEAKEINSPNRKAATFDLEIPLAQLQAGWYTAQVNIIDDAAGKFSFSRFPILVR